MERITNDLPAGDIQEGTFQKKEQNTENMSKEMKSLVYSESSNKFSKLDYMLQGMKGMSSQMRARNMKIEAWSQKTPGRAVMETEPGQGQ